MTTHSQFAHGSIGRSLVLSFSLVGLAICSKAKSQTATFSCKATVVEYSTVYFSDSFIAKAENTEAINNSFRDYMNSKYGVAHPQPGCSSTPGADIAMSQAETLKSATSWRTDASWIDVNMGRHAGKVVMTGWVMAQPVEETHTAKGAGPSQAEAVQDARQNALRGSRDDIKKWIAPACTQGTAKGGLYNEKTVVNWTCSVSFVTSTDKTLPSAHSAYGEGSTKVQAVAAAKGSASRDHSGVDNFDLPVCSQNTKKGGLYNEKTVANWYCSVGYTATH